MKTPTILAIAALALLLPRAGTATQYGVQTMANWKASDKCAAAAHQQFPDYTPEANAKRDAATKACLAQGIRPPRDALSPPAPAK
jgi:hypothetical protein